MSRYEYTWAQQFFGNADWLQWFGVQKWYPSSTSMDVDRYRWIDKTVVVNSEKVLWPDELKGLKLWLEPSTDVYKNSMYGIPMQVSSSLYQTVTEWDFWSHGVVQRQVPYPFERDRWIEGHPAIGGAFDRHWVGVAPSGVTHEVLGWDQLKGTVGQWGVWLDGKLTGGEAATAAGVSLSSILLNRNDSPHRLGITLSDYGGVDGAKDWVFPRCGDVVRLSEEAYRREMAKNIDITFEEQTYLTSLRGHGAIIYDKTGERTPQMRVGFVAGAQWTGNKLARVTITTDDLEVVTD